jgi:hypothetical protein
MMQHEFMSSNKIPDLMPVSTLVCPPSQDFVHKYKVQPVFSSLCHASQHSSRMPMFPTAAAALLTQ